MSASDVKISIITATWNAADTVLDCLDSVNGQDYVNVEHIVIDGASVDGTVEILHERRSSLACYVSEPDRGIYDALNKGILCSTGDVVGFLHADDLYAHAGVLTDVARAFEDPELCAVYGDLQYVMRTDVNQVVRHWVSAPFTSRCLASGWMPPHPTLYVRREWYERIGGFDTRYRIAADYFSILQLFSRPDFKAVYMPQVMVKMRLGGASNRSIKDIIRKSTEDYDALRRSGFSMFASGFALVSKNLSKVGQFLSAKSA